MQYSSAFITFLAASGAVAAPSMRITRRGNNNNNADSEIRVVLLSSDTGSQTVFEEGDTNPKNPTGSSGPFDNVELRLGDDVENQELRCALYDNDGEPIILERGENVDTTFADGGNGPWKFRDSTEVDSIVCNDDFEKGDASGNNDNDNDGRGNGGSGDDDDVRVQLSDGNQAIQEALDGSQRTVIQPRNDGPWNEVALNLPEDFENEELRCAIFDEDGKPFVVERGDNVDVTFADGGNGPWKIQKPGEVTHIVCDPKFEKKE